MDKKNISNNVGKALIRMRNITRKLKPSDFWNIGEYESWFSDMAREGLHLKKVGKIFAHFNHDEPRKMRYRIDVSQKNEDYKISEQEDYTKLLQQEDYIKLKQKEKYSEIGWEYVTSYAEFNVYASPVEQNAPELYIDPVEQAYTLDELNENYKKKVNLSIVEILLMIGLLFAAW